jgi:DNA repair protein RecO
MIVKTPAIPLYWTDVSNTSRIVTWLTAHFGKISTSIKGDQRRNSLFRGQYDLFSTSELLFYDRAEREIFIAKECSLLTPRTAFRTNWRACAAAGYIAALFAKTTPRHGHETGRFAFFEEMLSWAESCENLPVFLCWFDLKFADFQGHALRLSAVNPAETTGSSPLRFSAEHGGLVRADYAQQHRLSVLPMDDAAVEHLKAWQKAPAPPGRMDLPCPPGHLAQINRALERFVTLQFDLPPHVRRTAAEILTARQP